MPSVLLAAAAAAGPVTAVATDRAEANRKAVPTLPAEYRPAPESIAVVIEAGSDELWKGALRLGAPHGHASFSMSKNEFAEPCPGEPASNHASSSSLSLNFNISRHNWPNEPHKFNVNVNWSQPLRACEGQGSDMLGFNRVVEVPPGRTISIQGAGGLLVRLTRQP